MHSFSSTRNGNYLKIHHPMMEHPFTVSGGNMKVKFPIITFGSSLECVNKLWCPYSKFNPNKELSTPKCYAQKIETLRTNVRIAMERNNRFIVMVVELGLISEFSEFVAIEIWFAWKSNIVRYNEGGDLDDVSTDILVAMSETYKRMGDSNNEFSHIFPTRPVTLYGYSHSDGRLVDRLRQSGVSVMISDVEFVVVDSFDDVPIGLVGAVRCGGECSDRTCTACVNPTRNVIIKRH